MSEIDWSMAPEGATHWEPPCAMAAPSWMKIIGGEWYYWPPCADNPSWVLTNVSDAFKQSRLSLMVPRPISAPAWTGEGLPPVGTECECQNQSMEWLSGTIVYTGKDKGIPLAIMQTDTEILYGEAGEFRPIRTPEQIAAQEREKAIQEMVDTCSHPGSTHTFADCERLYDAGYRKQN